VRPSRGRRGRVECNDAGRGSGESAGGGTRSHSTEGPADPERHS
jgi:hypothetical protein